jgi:GTP-binding protein HflX
MKEPQLNIPKEPHELKRFKTALLIASYSSGGDRALCEEFLNELERLCETFGLQVVGKIPCSIKKIDAATFLGEGKIDELVAKAQEVGAEVIIFDDEISPQQQRNLEKIFQKPVIDRTELIIEVFAQRAQTNEARLQIELAKIRYQIPRLKRLWTHLERQAGGGGFMGGPGEKQIELDKRMLKHRMIRLEKEIKRLRPERGAALLRLRTGVPTFAIVGYTNAGNPLF